MLKKILSVFVFLLAAYGSHAQANEPAKDSTAADTVYKKILVIPYNPMMHLSDADHEIAEYSQKKPETIRSVFRRGILQSVTGQLFGIGESQPLLSDFSTDIQKDLEMVYGSISYSMDTIFPILHPVKDSLKKKPSLFSKSSATKIKEVRDVKYMNTRLSHPELLVHLSGKYGAELFVFLNQLEIKTNYSDCLDLALKIYRRELKVHYSVFNSSGKQVYGDVAIVDFPSNSNDVAEIMRKNFPKISEYILNSIPKKNSK